MSEDLERKSTPWLTAGFDWEGVAAALAALLIGMLLGAFWSVLFWIGFAIMVAALLSGRWSKRAVPDLANGIIAPCDGLVVSVSREDPPSELRMTEKPTMRIRISSSPAATNRLYAPIAGSLESLIVETGDRSVPLAMRPEDEGLTVSYLTFESQGHQVGVRLASGGLGPRQEIEVEAGDILRLGRIFGKRRLGGWCDIYVPANTGQLIWPGQTLVGGETVLGRLKSSSDPDLFEDMMAEEEPEGAEEEVLDEVQDDGDDYYPEPDETDTPEDPAVMFARLREAAKNKPAGD
ncbi:phosphatidylserine decarboxylase [Hyphomonas pacifica]|uniref:phosphatidylserine decarboxylase n=1 Tax=Hyphomonas pacifica TaxID=1280941 RepID=UPI000DC02FDB|nr:phosphatidylserine decarboxylase [Hyphomonas pacifica]RAN38104.1 hypothetical protein HY11_07520 [Hyphomonas pacifica]